MASPKLHALTHLDVISIANERGHGESVARFRQRIGIGESLYYKLAPGHKLTFRTVTLINQRLNLSIEVPL